MPEPAVLAQPESEVREPVHISEDQASGSDTVLGTHRVAHLPYVHGWFCRPAWRDWFWLVWLLRVNFVYP